MGSSASYFEDLYLNFGTMPTWSTTSDWQNMGCGNYEAVVALQIRLEGSYFYPQTTSAAYCSLHAGATPVTRHDFAQWAPKCSYDASGVQYRAFRVRDAHDLLPKDMYSFWRCAECTRYQTIAVPALGMFGCTLPGGVPLDNLFTEDMLAKTFPYLYNPEALAALLGSGTIGQETFLNQSTALLILSKLQALGELSQLTYYGGGCTAAAMWDCPSFSDGYDTGLTLQSDQIAWNKAVSNPTVPLTMTCNGQQYTTKNEVNCNPNTDQRRQKLAEFAEAQYRRADGVWLQQVQQGWGVAFEANVAHSSVNLFTLFYASADRPPEQVFASWVLGAGPCASQARPWKIVSAWSRPRSPPTLRPCIRGWGGTSILSWAWTSAPSNPRPNASWPHTETLGTSTPRMSPCAPAPAPPPGRALATPSITVQTLCSRSFLSVLPVRSRVSAKWR